MTKKEIKYMIQYLQDDNTVCRNIMKDKMVEEQEKAECKSRIEANNERIKTLQEQLKEMEKREIGQFQRY